jgi:hypothetical protein
MSLVRTCPQGSSGRPWLTGVTMSSVHVTLADEADEDDEDPDR